MALSEKIILRKFAQAPEGETQPSQHEQCEVALNLLRKMSFLAESTMKENQKVVRAGALQHIYTLFPTQIVVPSLGVLRLFGTEGSPKPLVYKIFSTGVWTPTHKNVGRAVSSTNDVKKDAAHIFNLLKDFPVPEVNKNYCLYWHESDPSGILVKISLPEHAFEKEAETLGQDRVVGLGFQPIIGRHGRLSNTMEGEVAFLTLPNTG